MAELPRPLLGERPVPAVAGPGQHVPLTLGAAIFDSLAIRNYRWLWISNLFSFAAMQMNFMTRGWLAYEITHSPLALALVTGAWGVPVVALSLFGGALADRIRKRNLLVGTQLAGGLIVLWLAVMIATGRIQLWHLALGAALNGVVMAFNMPGRQSFVNELVPREKLMNAVALNSMGMNLTRIGAPALAGILVGAIGIADVYFLMAGLYLLAIGSLLMIPAVALGVEHRESILRDVAQGLRYVRGQSLLLLLLLLAFVPVLFGQSTQSLLPVFAKAELHLGPAGLGVMMSALGAGSLLGSLLVAALTATAPKGALMLASGLAFGLAILLFANAPWLSLALAGLALMGITSQVYMTLNTTVLQLRTDTAYLGRVMSISMMTFGLMPLGALPLGAIAEGLGAPVAATIGGGIAAAFVVGLALTQPSLRRLR
ncbi:MAG: MFS transporter [Chloroflexi bacterium]|nr:MFS transporter [Chloroflexota bacterium]